MKTMCPPSYHHNGYIYIMYIYIYIYLYIYIFIDIYLYLANYKDIPS